MRKKTNALSWSRWLEFLQSARQKKDIPSTTKENGIGFPENKVTLPELNLNKLLSGPIKFDRNR